MTFGNRHEETEHTASGRAFGGRKMKIDECISVGRGLGSTS
jgi:hypothetical protein